MESTIAQKLESLAKLQELDSKHDGITKVRGALPDEVRDLEDELAGYETRLSNFSKDLDSLSSEIEEKKKAIKDCEAMIKKYEEQQMNVRNNREYDAITKEMELQSLEIQVSEKRIKEAYERIELKNEEITATKELISEREKDLKSKQDELDGLLKESEVEEKKLDKERAKAAKAVDERLLIAYDKLRNNARNGLAVVEVKRGACGGCFNVVPPQRQADIREKKKIIVCEHCGRILYDVDMESQIEKPKARRTTRKKKADAAAK